MSRRLEAGFYRLLLEALAGLFLSRKQKMEKKPPSKFFDRNRANGSEFLSVFCIINSYTLSIFCRYLRLSAVSVDKSSICPIRRFHIIYIQADSIDRSVSGIPLVLVVQLCSARTIYMCSLCKKLTRYSLGASSTIVQCTYKKVLLQL